MTITEALSNLRTLDKRIQKSARSLAYHAVEVAASGQASVGQQPFPSVEAAKKVIVSNHDKVLGLIEQRAKLKGAIVASNAKTEITIGKKTMTVAEAIEYKTSINAKVIIQDRLRLGIQEASRLAEDNERRINALVNRKVDSILGNKKSLDENDSTTKVIEAQVRESERITIHDPLNAVALHETISEEVQEFLSNIDVVLTVSNSTTFIEV